MSQLVMSCFSYKPLVKKQSSKSIYEIIEKVNINKLHMVKLKTGVSVKIKIKSVDDESIYGILYQNDIYGVEQRYENDRILISNIDDIRVRKIYGPGVGLAIAIPTTAIAIVLGAATLLIIFGIFLP